MYIVWSSSLPGRPATHDSVKAIEINGDQVTVTRGNGNRTHFCMADRKVFVYANKQQAIKDKENNGMIVD